MAAKRFTADVQQRDLRLAVGGKPPQHSPCIGMLFGKPYLPLCGSAMWPEILAPETDCGRNVLLTNGLRLGTSEHRPV